MEWFASLGPASAGWPSAVIPDVLRFAVNGSALAVLGTVAALLPLLLAIREAVARSGITTEILRLRVLEGRKVLGRHAA